MSDESDFERITPEQDHVLAVTVRERQRMTRQSGSDPADLLADPDALAECMTNGARAIADAAHRGDQEAVARETVDQLAVGLAVAEEVIHSVREVEAA